MELSIITFVLFFVSVGVINILWLMDIRPFVKQYTGGKAQRLWWNSAIFQDYFLAKKIIREERVKTPSGIRFIEILILVNILFIVSTIIEINWHNQRLEPIVKTPINEVEAQGTQPHP